jgi:hypothetical protein
MFETFHDWGLDPHLVAPEPGVAENLVGRAELSVEREEHTAGTKPGPELPDTGSLQRLHYDTKSKFVLYQPRSKNRKTELLNPLEFVARVLIHIPQPNQHSILYYGAYARRGTKNSRDRQSPGADDPDATERKILRKRWANLIRRVFKTDPLICKKCGGKMRVVSFITRAQRHPPDLGSPPEPKSK